MNESAFLAKCEILLKEIARFAVARFDEKILHKRHFFHIECTTPIASQMIFFVL